jgi:hypothetical protein
MFKDITEWCSQDFNTIEPPLSDGERIIDLQEIKGSLLCFTQKSVFELIKKGKKFRFKKLRLKCAAQR